MFNSPSKTKFIFLNNKDKMSSSKRKDKTTLTNKKRQDIVTYKSKHPNITNIELIDWVKKEFKLDIYPSTKKTKNHPTSRA